MALTVDDFADVQSALWEARHKWFSIGVRLRLKVPDLEAIDHELGLDLEGKFVRMILSWLESGQTCTWRALREALEHHIINLPVLAREIKTNFGSNESQSHFVQCMYVFRLSCLLSMQMHAVCSLSGTLVGDDESADNNTSTDVTVKENASSAEYSGKHLILYYTFSWTSLRFS